MTSINDISPHIDRIDDGIKLTQIILLIKGSFVGTNSNRANFKIFVMNKLFKIMFIKLLHESFAFIFI